MKSNILKTVTKSRSVIFRYERDQGVSRPHYFPSKQILSNKKDIKTSTLNRFFSLD